MKTILNLIHQNLKNNRKTVIYSQSDDLVRAILDVPGKLSVGSDNRYWGIVAPKTDSIPMIGLDVSATHVVITKRPIRFGADWTIVHTPMRSPIIVMEDRPERSDLINGSFLFVDDPTKYSNMFEVVESGDAEVYNYTRYVKGEKAIIIKKFCDPLDLCMLHDIESVHVASSVLWEVMPSLLQCQAVMESMSMLGSVMGEGSSVDLNWIARHAIVNAFAIPRTLDLLEAMRCLRSRTIDESTVVIQKKPPCPATIEFGNIPEGMFYLSELRKLLGKDVLKLLKSYEGKGIVFGFSEKKHRYYEPIMGADREAYRNASNVLADQTQRWKNVAGNSKWLNNMVSNMVNRQVTTNDVYLTNEDMSEVERVGETHNITL